MTDIFASFALKYYFACAALKASGTGEDSLATHACLYKAVNQASVQNTSWHNVDYVFMHEDLLQAGATHGTFNSKTLHSCVILHCSNTTDHTSTLAQTPARPRTIHQENQQQH